MTEQITHTVDRTGWGPGPWDTEPDRLEWRSPELPGYPLLIVRNHHGALCGYVGVAPGHPLHGNAWGDWHHEVSLDVHGGVTYSAACAGPVCHVPAEGEPDNVWWIGFDCGHAWDQLPDTGKIDPEYTSYRLGTYRDMAYVRSEVESLARQLAEMGRQ